MSEIHEFISNFDILIIRITATILLVNLLAYLVATEMDGRWRSKRKRSKPIGNQ